jgi:hypothetical protein
MCRSIYRPGSFGDEVIPIGLATDAPPGYQKNLLPLSYGHGPQTVLLSEQVFKRQRRLATTALLGLAPARSARASAANHRESISACRRDDLGVATGNVTSKAMDHACPQHSCAPPGRLRRAEITA